jgi:hypothetical protein
MRVVFVLKLNFFQYSGHPGPLYFGYPPSPYFSYEKITHTLPSHQFPVHKETQAAEKMKGNPMVNKAVLSWLPTCSELIASRYLQWTLTRPKTRASSAATAT